MVKCPKCNCEEYEILYSNGFNHYEDIIDVTLKVECAECGKKFWIRQLFYFESEENIKGE